MYETSDKRDLQQARSEIRALYLQLRGKEKEADEREAYIKRQEQQIEALRTALEEASRDLTARGASLAGVAKSVSKPKAVKPKTTKRRK